MDNLRRRLYEVIEASTEKDSLSKAYDILIITTIAVGLIPLTLKEDNIYVKIIDIFTTIIFLSDYAFRVYTADYKMGVFSYKAYMAYLLSFGSLIDLICVISGFSVLFSSQSAINIIRILRVFAVFKLTRYTKLTHVIQNVLRKVKQQLLTVLVITIIYILVSAMMIFRLEPDLFETFFDAVYWATISITTIGYGDISPVTFIGRLITMISALIGVAVIALPTGIISAAYMDEIKKKKGRFEL